MILTVREHEPEGLAYAGLVPSFFEEAVFTAKGIDDVADVMDSIYGFGGFKYPFEGEIDSYGVWHSPHEEDEPLDPLLSIQYNYGDITMYFYPYAITALVDSEGNQKIGRFD